MPRLNSLDEVLRASQRRVAARQKIREALRGLPLHDTIAILKHEAEIQERIQTAILDNEHEASIG